MSLEASCDVGVTLTFTWLSRLSRRDGPEPAAPKPKAMKLRCFCCSAREFGCKAGGMDEMEEDEAFLVSGFCENNV